MAVFAWRLVALFGRKSARDRLRTEEGARWFSTVPIENDLGQKESWVWSRDHIQLSFLFRYRILSISHGFSRPLSLQHFSWTDHHNLSSWQAVSYPWATEGTRKWLFLIAPGCPTLLCWATGGFYSPFALGNVETAARQAAKLLSGAR